jgi:hypothetical protein
MKTFKGYLEKAGQNANLRLSIDPDLVAKEQGDKSIILVGDQIRIDYPGSEGDTNEEYDTPKAHTRGELT